MLCCGLVAALLAGAALFRRQLAAALLAASLVVPVAALAIDAGAPLHATSFCGERP